MDKIKLVEEKYLKQDTPQFNVGDTVRVEVKIVEGEKTRLQAFEGIVIRKKGSGVSSTFTLRRVSYGEGVERTFPLHSPLIEKISVLRTGRVRRAKLYYLRKRVGKKVGVEEKIE
jgi:large subunit ribosomal protein L19